MGTTGIEGFDLYYDTFASLLAGGATAPAWSPDGKTVGYIDGPPDDRRAWQVDLASGERSELFDVAAIRQTIAEATGETPPGRGVPFAQMAFMAPRMVVAQVGQAAVTIDLDTGAVRKRPVSVVDEFLGVTRRGTPQQFWRRVPLGDPARAVEVPSPDGRFWLSTRDHNLIIRSTVDGRDIELTSDGTEEADWRFDLTDPMLAAIGLAVPVTNWSPDGNRIAAYRVDSGGVAQQPQTHYLKRDDEVVWRYHAKAGGVLERVTLYLVDVYGRVPLAIDLGDTTDCYPIHAGWLPGGRELLILRMSRDCRHIDVLIADANTGDVRPVFSEDGETFLRIHHDIYYGRKLGLWLVPDGQHLLWASERSGTKQLYLYDLSGQLVRQLTTGDGPVDYVTRLDREHVYFTAHSDGERPYDLHLWRVPLAGGNSEILTEEAGVHTSMFSPTGEAFIDTWSRPDAPPAAVLRRTDGTLLTTLSRAETSRLDEAGWVAPREFTVTAADRETVLWGTMFFPHDFDPGRRYPLIEYIYAGPQIAVAPHSFASAFTKIPQALAQLGYVTVMLDARGTPERSKAFHDAVYRNWAVFVDDHAEAISQLATREPFLDSARVAVIGHSWGAYSAFRCLADRPDVYQAAVSSAPGFDPYSSVLYECYLGLPQDNRAAYDAAQTLTLAHKVQGEFLLAGGTIDHATWTDAVKMSEALIRAGKAHEFVVLPEQIHGFDSVHDSYFWRKVIDFLARTVGTTVGTADEAVS
jgi:dipeptidyl-peptidase-4